MWPVLSAHHQNMPGCRRAARSVCSAVPSERDTQHSEEAKGHGGLPENPAEPREGFNFPQINSATGSRWKSAVQQGAVYVPSRAQLQEPFQWLPESFSLFYSHQSEPSPYTCRRGLEPHDIADLPELLFPTAQLSLATLPPVLHLTLLWDQPGEIVGSL